MPNSSESRSSDSSTISSRQLKQAKGRLSTGSEHTSPTPVLGSSAGPPHSLCISVSMLYLRPSAQEGAGANVSCARDRSSDDRRVRGGARPERKDPGGAGDPQIHGCLREQSPCRR